MKIAQVTPIFPPAVGGMGTVAKDYTEALRMAGHSVDVFSPENYPGIFKHGYASITPSYLWKLRGYNLIHLHYPFYGSDHFVALASLIWRTPLVITYHMKNKASGFQSFLFLVHKLWEWFVKWRASMILVSSLDYARSIKLKHRNLVEMPFWVDIKKFNPDGRVQGRQKLAIPSDKMVFLFVGGLDDAHYFKGVDVLLESCSKLNLDIPWELIIVGSGNLKPKYEAYAKEKNIEQKVRFVGRVVDEELPIYYQVADVHLLPATDRSEAFGLVTLEAAASGVASVVTDLPGVRTLVSQNQTGLIVPANDIGALIIALTWMSQHREKVSEFGQNARKSVLDKYSKDVVVDKLQEVYVRCKLG